MACAASSSGQSSGRTPRSRSTMWIHASRQRAKTVAARSALRNVTGRLQSMSVARAQAASSPVVCPASSARCSAALRPAVAEMMALRSSTPPS